MSEQLVFLGTGEAFDTDHPNTSLLYRHADGAILFDCGFAVPRRYWQLGESPESLRAVALSHHHADHVFGLPALLLRLHEDGRQGPLAIIGGARTPDYTRRLMELAYPGTLARLRFSVTFMMLAPESPLELGFLNLRCAPTAHSLPNLAIRVDGGAMSFAYSGDGAATAASRELYRGVELLIHESYSLEQEFRGHARVPEVLMMARELGVGQLALVHLQRGLLLAVESYLSRQSDGLPVHLPRVGEVFELPLQGEHP